MMASSKSEHSSISLGLHAVGLIVVYSLYSIWQEKIMKGTYGPDDERFTSSSILVLCNRVFSMFVGFMILLWKSRSAQPGSAESFSKRIKPSSPILAYAAVAACNFCATFCQYEALRYVGFTTQALAKCCKMAPVLLVGRIVYKKTHPAKAWMATWVVLLGCATYLTSSSRNVDSDDVDTDAASTQLSEGIMGTLLIFGYLFFDGLTSTTQEKVFGKSPSSTDPFGSESPVLDQMLWTNFFSILISFLASAATFATTLVPSLALLIKNPTLAFDVFGLSATAAFGLIILLNTIAAFGALTSSTIMTVRQFLSILLNAGVFGNFSSVGAQGWTGVFWVAGGIAIKLDRRWDEPKKSKIAIESPSGSPSNFRLGGQSPSGSEEDEELLFKDEKASTEIENSNVENYDNVPKPSRNFFSYLAQYGPPLVVPLFIGAIFSFFTGEVPNFDTISSYIPETLTPNVAPGDVDIDAATIIEGGMWAQELHDAINPTCLEIPETKSYTKPLPRTALATFPRSGNSYIRSMMERSTGYRTSAMYCDHVLSMTFKGECDHENNFLVKTHYPAVRTHPLNSPDHWTQFDRVLHVVRNPLDAVYSYYAWQQNGHDHSHAEDVDKPYGDKQAHRLIQLTQRYVVHDEYWASVPLLTHQIRYEDLRETPLPVMMDAISFILPKEELPSLDSLACTVELNEAAQAYHSAKRSVFASWDRYEPQVRLAMIKAAQKPWCRYGYEDMAKEAGLETGIDCNKIPDAPRKLRR